MGALFSSTSAIVADLKALIEEKKCGPILIRLSWHDAGVYNGESGCPNAAMRFPGGEGSFGANAGLHIAIELLKPIKDKYSISNADLWALAANVAIESMGGPAIKTRFGRVDATSEKESVESQEGRLPDGDKGVDHLKAIFYPKGFDDKDIVALSGAHTVGSCHADRSGFDGKWTDDPLKFDNSYFKDLLSKKYKDEITKQGCPQKRSGDTIMLISDLALLQPPFKEFVDKYAADQDAFFTDFTAAWIKLQENGVSGLKDDL